MILKFTTPRPSPSFEIQTDFGRIWEGAFIKCFRGKPLQWGGALDELRLYAQNPPLTDLLPARTKISEIVPRRKFWRSSFQSLASIPIPSQSLFVAKTELKLFPPPAQTMLAWIYQWNSAHSQPGKVTENSTEFGFPKFWRWKIIFGFVRSNYELEEKMIDLTDRHLILSTKATKAKDLFTWCLFPLFLSQKAVATFAVNINDLCVSTCPSTVWRHISRATRNVDK